MKIRNLAFCGVMASILTGWGASADTIIASKAYVDARDATKQNTLSSASGGNIVESGSGNVVTGISAVDGTVTVTKGTIAATDYIKNGTNALNLSMATGEDKDSMAPSITAIEGMKQGAITSGTVDAWSTSSGDGADNNKVPTTKAITQQLDLIRTAINTGDTGITRQFEDGMSAATLEAFNAWKEDSMPLSGTKYDALVTAIANDSKYHNAIADTADPNKLARNSNIQKGTMYMMGHGIQNHQTNIDNTIVVRDKDTSKASWDKVFVTEKAGDDYVPTMAAVEARVLAAEEAAGSGLTNKIATQGNSTATWNTVTSDNKGTSVNLLEARSAKDSYVPTVAAVEKRIESLDAAGVDGSSDAETTADRGKPVVAISQANGVISAELGQVKEAGIEDSAVTSAKIANGAIINEDINANAAIDFSKMSDALKDVNSASTDATCSAGSPCVLTFYKVGNTKYYKWTNMDTESTNAVPNS